VRIVHQDERFVVVDKPSGLLAIPGRTVEDSVVTRIRALFPHATGPLMVHRLDMDTSGLMVVALDEESQRALSMAFEARAVKKGYVAIVGGALDADEGVVRLATRLDVDRRPRQIVDPVHGRPGETRWRVISRGPGARARVALEPLTGRTHQLRVHAALGLGAPILGDRLYGDPHSAPRLLLHAEHLEVPHPSTQARVRVHSPPDF
jgi:tRNA pseudouridine32 synthase/23S rRNA pseudouridine746 synthase